MTDISKKIILNYDELLEKIKAHKTLDQKIVCTIGSWDMLHIGHLRYLYKSKEYGDILLVGVDSDKGIKSYKGPLRPIIPQNERIEMLTYQNCVNYVNLINDIDDTGAWQYELIKKIPIDVFVTVAGNSYTKAQITKIKSLCKSVVDERRNCSD